MDVPILDRVMWTGLPELFPAAQQILGMLMIEFEAPQGSDQSPRHWMGYSIVRSSLQYLQGIPPTGRVALAIETGLVE